MSRSSKDKPHVWAAAKQQVPIRKVFRRKVNTMDFRSRAKWVSKHPKCISFWTWHRKEHPGQEASQNLRTRGDCWSPTAQSSCMREKWGDMRRSCDKWGVVVPPGSSRVPWFPSHLNCLLPNLAHSLTLSLFSTRNVSSYKFIPLCWVWLPWKKQCNGLWLSSWGLDTNKI